MRKVALGLACALIFAGCLAASAQTESAMSLESDAMDRAEEKLDNPRLVGLWGVETPREVTSNDTELQVHLDDDPGDGNAAGWAYRFIGDERTGIVTVADEIGVVAEFWADLDDDDEIDEPELTWEVDSEEAASILADNETWPETTDAHALHWSLSEGDDDERENATVWTVEAREIDFEDEDERHHAVVDAETGEIYHVSERGGYGHAPASPSDPAEPEQARGSGGCDKDSESGAVSPTSTQSARAELPEPGRVAISVEYTGAGPIDLELSNSETTVWDEQVMATGSDSLEEQIDQLPADGYTLEASTDTGSANVDVEIVASWGDGGNCWDWDWDYDTSSNTPNWVRTDRTLGVASVG